MGSLDDEQFGFLVAGLGAISRYRMGEQIPAMADEKVWKEVRQAVPHATLVSEALEEDLEVDCKEKGLIGPRG